MLHSVLFLFIYPRTMQDVHRHVLRRQKQVHWLGRNGSDVGTASDENLLFFLRAYNSHVSPNSPTLFRTQFPLFVLFSRVCQMSVSTVWDCLVHNLWTDSCAHQMNCRLTPVYLCMASESSTDWLDWPLQVTFLLDPHTKLHKYIVHHSSSKIWSWPSHLNTKSATLPFSSHEPHEPP